MTRECLEQDNILFPDFENDFNGSIPTLGKYGRMRLNYLKTAKPALFLEYRKNGTLVQHLISVEEEAIEMLIKLEDRYIAKNPLPSGDDFMAVVRARNTARLIAEEFVLNDVIYR